MEIQDALTREQPPGESLGQEEQPSRIDALAAVIARLADFEEIPLEQVSILKGLDPGEIAAVKARLTRVATAKGGVVFREGDSGSEMFIVTRGTASAYISQPGDRDVRLATFAPGSVFGELAILDAGPRSASIIADDEFVAYAMSQAQFAALSRESSLVAIKLLASLASELSGRLRRANRMIDQLEM